VSDSERDEHPTNRSPADPVLASFANGLVHELNNILGTILGNAELAAMDRELSASSRTSIEEILKAVRQGLRLSQQILAFGRARPLPAGSPEWRAFVDEAARILRTGKTEGVGLDIVVTGEPETPASEPLPGTTAGPQDRAAPHVVFLDDEEAMVHLATRMLVRLGYRVTGFSQPEKALESIRRDPSAVDIVVTDYNMPRLSGIAVAREVVRMRPDLPVMVTSGNITDEMRAQADAEGVRYLVDKPGSVDELCRAVERTLANAARAAAPLR